MKKSSTLTTTTSMPTSPTLSAQTLSASKMSLSSSNSSRSGGRASSCQSHGPIRPGSGCVDAIKAKREEIEVDTLLEKAKFYTSVCLGEWESYQRERERDLLYLTIFSRYDCHTVGVHISVPDTFCRRSRHLNDHCRLRSGAGYVRCH